MYSGVILYHILNFFPLLLCFCVCVLDPHFSPYPVNTDVEIAVIYMFVHTSVCWIGIACVHVHVFLVDAFCEAAPGQLHTSVIERAQSVYTSE
jgi:hypothetical protein